MERPLNDRPFWMARLTIPELTPEAFALEAEAQLLQDAAGVADFVLEQREDLRRRAITGLEAAARYSDVVDAALRRMFLLAAEATGTTGGPGLVPELAVVATGGYGRRELSPFSDIDVAFVPAREEDPAIDNLVRALFHLMMDALSRKAGLKVGYSYRVLGDCETLELQTQTTLIDARFIAGEYSLFSDFKKALRTQMQPARFVFDRAWERTVAPQGAASTLYHLQPDIKNGTGGLRTIQTAMWLAQVRFGVWSPAIWEELIDRDVVAYRDVERLYDALEFYHRLRNAMHWRAGKASDVLMVTQQADVAATLEVPGDDQRSPAERLMETFYRHAELVTSVAQRVISWVLASRMDLGYGLACVRRAVECTSPDIFLAHPSNIVRAFQLSQALNIPLDMDLQETIRHAVSGPARLQPDRACGPLLLRVLESAERVSSTLRTMASLGVLGWLLPEFAGIMRLPSTNTAHEFTIGYHSLEVVRRLEEMQFGQDGETAAEAASHLDYKATLYLAGLLHDVGKAVRGQPHSEAGAALVPAMGMRLELPQHEMVRLQLLVARHLLMSEISRFRDLTQDASIRELLAVAPDQPAIDHLYLLTLADGMSVGKGVWTPLQSRFLEELYHRASQALAYPLKEPEGDDLRRYQRRVAQALSGRHLDQTEVEEHVEFMPASYLLNTPSDTIALHLEMLQRLQSSGKPVVEFRDDRDAQFTELIICALDDPAPGLLSKVAACLWAMDVDVHSAQVYTREKAPCVAIDTLWIDYSGRLVEPRRKRQVELALIDVLSGSLGARELLRRTGKGAEMDAPIHELQVDVHRSEGYHICEIRTGDHRGLLFQLTRAISDLGWDIHSARIHSSGARTRDVFYVAAANSLAPPAAARLLRERLENPPQAAD